MGHRRQTPRQHGRRRVQARGARPDLPQVHLRRLRGKARASCCAREGADGADPEDRDEYRADNVFWVPKEARWGSLQASAKQPDHRQAHRRRHGGRSRRKTRRSRACCRRTTPGPASTRHARRADRPRGRHRPGRLRRSKSRTCLGRVYEYFLGKFASAEGKSGGQFYTPRCVVRDAGGDARAVQGPGVRPLLRLRRHVRAEREVRRGPRRHASATSRSTARSPTTPPGASPR